MSNAINSKSVPLTSIFDPYISGTTKARASGIDDAGTDTSNLYANIIYGSAAPATGIQSQDADLNTLYAKKGTAQYKLPIDGNSYTAAGQSSGVAPIKLAEGTVNVQVGGGQYNVQTRVINNGGIAVVHNYTYTVPSGMTHYYVTLTGVTQGIGGSHGDQPSWASIPGALTTEAFVDTANQSNNGTQVTSGTANLYFAGDNLVPIWSGSFTIYAQTDISA